MNKIREYLRMHSTFTTKIIAVLLAVLLWSYVMKNENPIFTRNFSQLPIEIRYENYLKDQGLTIIPNEDLYVDVRVEGRRNIINSIKLEDLHMYVDMREYQKNRSAYKIYYSLPSGITIDKLSRNNVGLKFGTNEQKELPLKINTAGKVSANNMVVDQLAVNQEMVTISGIKSKVDRVRTANIDVDLGTVTKSTMLSLPLYFLDENGDKVQGIDVEKKEVQIRIELSHYKTVPIELTTIGEMPSNISIRNTILSNRSCTLLGSKKELQNIGKVKTEPIDLNSVKGNTIRELSLNLPNNVRVKDNQKYTVYFEMDGNVEKSFNLNNSNIRFVNQNNREVSIPENNDFKVILSGTEEDLRRIEDKKIELNVDLKDANIGFNSYPVTMKNMEGIILKQLNPRMIKLIIK